MYCLYALFLILLASAPLQAQPTVEIFSVTPDAPQERQVRIVYRLIGTADKQMTVSVRVSDNGGKSYTVPATHFSGDVGSVGPGIEDDQELEIVWDAAADVPNSTGDQWKVKVIALDGDGVRLEMTLRGGATMEFMWIPAGTYLRGSPTGEVGRDMDEGPQHEVVISRGFYLASTEISEKQWSSVVDDTLAGTDAPQANISWTELQEKFIARLNQSGGLVYRLPTEAEWEYAARAGTTTPWSFGADASLLDEYAWHEGNAEGEVHPADGDEANEVKIANHFGLFNMHGNVAEWVQDGYQAYSGDKQVDPSGDAASATRVYRGGGFNDDAPDLRSAARNHNAPALSARWLGARLLLEAP